jgi:hypothetical protein
MYREVSILSPPLIEQIRVFRKSISIYFLAPARIYLILYTAPICLTGIYL